MRSVSPISILALVALIGCSKKDEDSDTEDTHEWLTCEDADSDGVCPEDGDCDDTNPNIVPGGREVCNGQDDNCNGVVDEGMTDVDGDGICDGEDVEECDGVDNDGDGMVDEDFGDADADGLADCVDTEECDGRDNNGDGVIDEGFDSDGDTFTQCGEVSGENVDCDDDNEMVYPGATEESDELDNDCDGLIDEDSWAVGDLLITELMVNPNNVADNLGEWIELHNNSSRTVYLNGLVIQSGTGENHQISADSPWALEAGGFVALGASGDIYANGGVALDYVYERLVLTNEGDEVSVWLFDETSEGNTATMLDQVYWSDDNGFPTGSGASMSLEPLFWSTVDNDEGVNWCLASLSWTGDSDFGTPGEANEPCVTYDHDGDGQSVADGDCDDADADVYLGAPEIDAAVDNDCDGTAELGPVASAVEGAASNAQVCGTVDLDGTGSYDPDGDTNLTYEWTLVSGPASSSLTSADILYADTDAAAFVPDEDGVYTFSLSVRDSGGAASVPADLVVTVGARTSNTAPEADAGGHQTVEGLAECEPSGSTYKCVPCDDYEFTIDASGSTDDDGDGLSYFWNISSGTGRVYNRWAETTRVIVSGPRPSYDTGKKDFVPATNTVFVDLVVTDCMGANSSVDTIALAYTCDGIKD